MKDWPFYAYEKMAASPREWGFDEPHFRALKRVPWVVTEKIHGANFVFVSDGSVVRHAKRKAYLTENDGFFGYAEVALRLDSSVLSLASMLKPKADHVFIYGELFGGSEHVLGPVQTGIEYSSSLQYFVFDIRCVLGGVSSFVDFEQLGELCETHGLISVEPLLQGTYREVLDASHRFPSTIAARLKEARSEDNMAEGVVVRPAREIPGLPCRPILKTKIEEFAEDERFAGSIRTSLNAPPMATGDESLQWLLPRLDLFFTPPRLASALSKLGRVDLSDPDERALLVEELVQDVHQTLLERLGALVSTLDADATTKLTRALREHADRLIR